MSEARRLTFSFGEDEVVRDAFVVSAEIVLNEVRPVPQAKDEVLMPVVGVILHYVPDNRPVADRHHGFRDRLRVLSHTHSHAAAK
jgi:hypothetical protein